jgi:hypothetical protein
MTLSITTLSVIIQKWPSALHTQTNNNIINIEQNLMLSVLLVPNMLSVILVCIEAP